MQEIERPPSLSDIATDKLRQAIIKGEFKLGENLSENKLAERLCISKTPIRHALAQMRVEGLVEVFPQKGTYVFTFSSMDFIKFSEHRTILEQAAMRLSHQRNKDEMVKRLTKVVETMRPAHEKGEVTAYLDQDVEYHRIFLDLCDNNYLAEGYGLIEAKISALRTHLGQKFVQKNKSFDEHVQMLELLKADKVNEAAALLSEHIEGHTVAYSNDEVVLSNS